MEMPWEDLELLKKEASEFGIGLDENQLQRFALFYDRLSEKNKVMNLTAITEPGDVVIKHFLDSLSIVKSIDMKNISTIIDMGTGAGFPGIPLRIAFPEIDYTLIDSLNKRLCFIQDFIDECNLDHIRTVHGRAEDLARDRKYRERYDLCVSRAVANLSVLAEYCLPFVKKGGCFAAYKTEQVEKEAADAGHALKLLGGEIERTEHFTLGPEKLPRAIIVIRKVRETPGKYPRKAGTPQKEPL